MAARAPGALAEQWRGTPTMETPQRALCAQGPQRALCVQRSQRPLSVQRPVVRTGRRAAALGVGAVGAPGLSLPQAGGGPGPSDVPLRSSSLGRGSGRPGTHVAASEGGRGDAEGAPAEAEEPGRGSGADVTWTRVVVPPPPTAYRDSLFDLAFIGGCRQAFGRVAGWQSPRAWEEGYLGMVEVSHALMRGRTAQQQQQAVLQGFPSVPPWFRKLFPYSDWGAELNAQITPAFFSWLVGPCTIEEAEIKGAPPSRNAGAETGVAPAKGETKLLRSAVKIEKCRYLETSGCVGMCVNLCKVPTQYFFNNELGMPLTMEPNFEDLSCRMVFGQTPPPLEEDPALAQPCFASCPTGNAKAASCIRLT